MSAGSDGRVGGVAHESNEGLLLMLMLQHRSGRLARTRAKRRAESHGGIIFIVAMTLAVLGSIGVFALRSASLEIRASGAGRQRTQAHHLAAFGGIGAATHDVQGPTTALYISQMIGQAQSCSSLYG